MQKESFTETQPMGLIVKIFWSIWTDGAKNHSLQKPFHSFYLHAKSVQPLGDTFIHPKELQNTTSNSSFLCQTALNYPKLWLLTPQDYLVKKLECSYCTYLLHKHGSLVLNVWIVFQNRTRAQNDI